MVVVTIGPRTRQRRPAGRATNLDFAKLPMSAAPDPDGHREITEQTWARSRTSGGVSRLARSPGSRYASCSTRSGTF